jgi:hypothetical protein
MRRWALLPLVLIFTTVVARASSTPPDRQPHPDLRALDRDDAAAEAAVASGDLDAALRYFDYAGHEQEDFARASLEYRLARQKLRGAVRDVFGRRTWARAAAALGVPRPGRGPAQRSLRRQGPILYVKNSGGGNEVPYVEVDGVWKVSVRNILLAAVQARFGPAVEYEEADLFVLAGKMGRVFRGRAEQLSALVDDVRAGRVKSAEELHAAIDRIRRGTEVQQPRE